MIRPPDRNGVAFTEATDGDLRGDQGARARVSELLGIPPNWATVRQVHGGHTIRVDKPGDAGEADAMWTTSPGLPLAVFTADCFGVVLHAPGAVGVAHSGWRGADAGVVQNVRDEMTAAGHPPAVAEVGPGIGACCFEVGDEVSARFVDAVGQTTWGTTSVDLLAVINKQMEGLEMWTTPGCTRHEDRWFSHRRDATPMRLATIGWI